MHLIQHQTLEAGAVIVGGLFKFGQIGAGLIGLDLSGGDDSAGLFLGGGDGLLGALLGLIGGFVGYALCGQQRLAQGSLKVLEVARLAEGAVVLGLFLLLLKLFLERAVFLDKSRVVGGYFVKENRLLRPCCNRVPDRKILWS